MNPVAQLGTKLAVTSSALGSLALPTCRTPPPVHGAGRCLLERFPVDVVPHAAGRTSWTGWRPKEDAGWRQHRLRQRPMTLREPGPLTGSEALLADRDATDR